MRMNKIVAIAVLAAFAAGCRTGRSLSDMRAMCDQTITMPVASFGQELTDDNMPPHLILLEASITDEDGKPRKVPMFSVNGTAVETDGCTEGSSDFFYSCVGARVTGAIKHDPAACEDKVVAIRADAGCKHECVAALLNASTCAGIGKLLLLSSKGQNSVRESGVIAFTVARPPAPSWVSSDKDAPFAFDGDGLEEFEEPIPPPDDMAESDANYREEWLLCAKRSIDIGRDEIVHAHKRVDDVDALDARFEEIAKDPRLKGKSIYISCASDSEHKTLVEVLSILHKHGFKRCYIFSM